MQALTEQTLKELADKLANFCAETYHSNGDIIIFVLEQVESSLVMSNDIKQSFISHCKGWSAATPETWYYWPRYGSVVPYQLSEFWGLVTAKKTVAEKVDNYKLPEEQEDAKTD